MGHCKDCQHWFLTPHRADPPDYGYCDRPAKPNALFVAEYDAIGCFATFGCVQWEPKPNEQADALKEQGGNA